MESKGATRSNEPIMDATRHSPVVMASAIAGSPLSFNLPHVQERQPVPSAAMAFKILGADIRHCNA